MGVNVEYTIHNAAILEDSWDAALAAVNKFLVSNKAKNLNYYKRQWNDLRAFIEDIGFRVEEYPGCLRIVWFERENACGEERFLSILAPYLNPNSVFECLDLGNGLHYRFVIQGGQLVIQNGKVVYENEGTPVVY